MNIRKRDSTVKVVKEIARQAVRDARGTSRSGSLDIVANYSKAYGGFSFDAPPPGSPGSGSLLIMYVFGQSGYSPGTETYVEREGLIGKGAVYLYDNGASNLGEINYNPYNDPRFVMEL